MSGKRFKKCCMDKIDVLKELPGRKVAEQYVLEKIIADSSIFRDFYKSERKKVAADIHWCVNPQLTSGMKTGSMSLPDGVSCFFMLIKQAPLETADAFDVAHEIQHLICASEGYPGITALDVNYFDLTGFLANITNAPIVNSRLAHFGFDLWPYYDKACLVQKKSLDDFDDDDETQSILLTGLYLQKALDWEVACKVSKRSDNEFSTWFEERFPKAALKAKDVLPWINEVGYDTPEKSACVLKGIIEKMGLENVLIVK
jgi:hypothetical protein